MDLRRAGIGLARSNPGLLALLLTAAGFTLILGTFTGIVSIYPRIGVETSTTLSHVTAILNGMTVVLLLGGWRAIRRGRVRRHRRFMISAFMTILLFLAVYLVRVGGGGTKVFVGPAAVRTAYLVMLGTHIGLSVIAVPLVLYALVLGLGHSPAALRETPHKWVGRCAATTWIVSLTLGLVAYVLLEHVYAWEWTVRGG